MRAGRQGSAAMTHPVGIGIRQDHTPGSFDIPQSPYTSSLQLCRRMSEDGGLWAITNVISGSCVKVVNTETCQYATLVMYARGGWWVGVKLGSVWLPDLDRTEKLSQPAQPDEPEACGNYYADEVAEMRHGTW